MMGAPLCDRGTPLAQKFLSQSVASKRSCKKYSRNSFSQGGAASILVRMQPKQLSALDRWIAKQADKPDHAEAVRRLIDIALTTNSDASRKKATTASARAAVLANAVLDSRMAADATAAERATRKRRLFDSQSSFCGVRKDHPK